MNAICRKSRYDVLLAKSAASSESAGLSVVVVDSRASQLVHISVLVFLTDASVNILWACCDVARWFLNGTLPLAGVPLARLRHWGAGRRPNNHTGGHAAYVWAAIRARQLPECVLGGGGR